MQENDTLSTEIPKAEKEFSNEEKRIQEEELKMQKKREKRRKKKQRKKQRKKDLKNLEEKILDKMESVKMKNSFAQIDKEFDDIKFTRIKFAFNNKELNNFFI